MRAPAAVAALLVGFTACGAGDVAAPPERNPAGGDHEAASRRDEQKADEPTSTRSPDSAYFSPERRNPRGFIRQWDAASDQMQVTGETATYVSMTSDCDPCDGFVEIVEEVFEGGGSVEFEGSTIVKIEKASGSDSTFLLTKDVPRTVVRHGDGRRDQYPGGRTTLRVVLKPARATWAVQHYWIEPTRS